MLHNTVLEGRDCCSVTATCLLQHLSRQRRGKLPHRCREARIGIDGKLSKRLNLFAFKEFVCKCAVTLVRMNNVFQNRVVYCNGDVF